MSVLTSTFTLANGVTIPAIGFGTWQIADGDDAFNAVSAALTGGYRHIDTARAYGNEASVGRAIADSGVPRDEVFITTKLPAEIKDYASAVASFEESLAALGTDYVDLYLIHAPWPWAEAGVDHAAGNADVWRAFEELHAAGRARAIGVSNFEVSDLEKLLVSATVTPHVNQIKFYIGNTQAEITAFSQAHGILVEGFSPLATGSILDNADVAEIATKYGVSVAQLSIRYVFQKNVLPLPKTTSPVRLAQNADIDFEIGAADIAFLDGLTNTATETHGPKRD